MNRATLAALLLSVPAFAHAEDPKCDGPFGWAATMAFVTLKNAELVENSEVDFTATRVVRLASERVGKDLYRQVHRIIFTKQYGPQIEVITVNNASHAECSESGVQVFLVSRSFHAD